MKPTRLALSLTSLLAIVPACATNDASDGDVEDGENDVATGKTDSPSSADSAMILALVNDIRLQSGELDEQVGLSTRVAEAITAHRDGEDGEWATDDDDHFDTLEELDAIPYVGPRTMEKMLAYAKAHDVRTKLRIDLSAQDGWSGPMVALESLNEELASEGIKFDAQLTLGARDGIKFLRVLKDLEKANEKLGRELDFDFTWDPSQYTGLCYEGEVSQIPAAVDGLSYSLFSIYMGIQAERWGTHKEVFVGDEEEWIRSQRDDNEQGDVIAVWEAFDTASSDFLMMTDGGQQGDGTEFFAVTIKRCE